MSGGGGETTTKIIRQKVKGHGGHHGGAWKVAYADFVTAMMALFITLWIVSMNEKVKANIAAYFEDPVKFSKQHSGSNPKPMDAKNIHPPKNPPNPKKDPLVAEMEKLKAEAIILEMLIQRDVSFKRFKDQIRIVVTEEGLRIELQEKSDREGVFFDLSSATLKLDAVKLLQMLSKEIGKMNNPVIMEGHTDSNPYKSSSYTNWDLSTDRANSARRVLETSLKKGQLIEVRGYADTKLRNPSNPFDHSNRRISILIKPNLHANNKEKPEPSPQPSAAGGHGSEPSPAPSAAGGHGSEPSPAPSAAGGHGSEPSPAPSAAGKHEPSKPPPCGGGGKAPAGGHGGEAPAHGGGH